MNSHCWHHKKSIENITDVNVWIKYLKKITPVWLAENVCIRK